jgi:chemotaxis protein histidine kinase CheA
MGGSYDIESKPGLGTKITLDLPLKYKQQLAGKD